MRMWSNKYIANMCFVMWAGFNAVRPTHVFQVENWNSCLQLMANTLLILYDTFIRLFEKFCSAVKTISGLEQTKR